MEKPKYYLNTHKRLFLHESAVASQLYPSGHITECIWLRFTPPKLAHFVRQLQIRSERYMKSRKFLML